MNYDTFKNITNKYSEILQGIESSCLNSNQKEIQTKALLTQYAVEIASLNYRWAIKDENDYIYKRFYTKNEALNFLNYYPKNFYVEKL